MKKYKYRLVGALRILPDHYMVITDDAAPTITESIRSRPEVPDDVKRRYCYLEVQRVDGDDYEVVDSWTRGRKDRFDDRIRVYED